MGEDIATSSVTFVSCVGEANEKHDRKLSSELHSFIANQKHAQNAVFIEAEVTYYATSASIKAHVTARKEHFCSTAPTEASRNRGDERARTRNG